MEVEKNGEAIIRRIYGGFETLNGWKAAAHAHAFVPVSQYTVTKGKNSTDINMVIEAMDFLHRGDIDGFCIVASDSDYHRLVTRLRESGRFVLGIGEKKTPNALVSACNVFVYVENLSLPPTEAKAEPTGSGRKPIPAKDLERLRTLLWQAFEAAQRPDGSADLGAVGAQLRVLEPGFDSRSFGRKQLRMLAEDSGLFTFTMIPLEGGGQSPSIVVKERETQGKSEEN
jgi:hypothetical protein